MRTLSISDNALHTALAALAGVAAAAAVKLLLDETASPTSVQSAAPRIKSRQAKLEELKAAAQDPLYLADMREVNDDFAFADAELL